MNRSRLFLACGPASAFVYVATDLVAAQIYPGYSLRDQAVSELFAISSPTSAIVAPLFSLSSLFQIAFAAGVWLSAAGDRALRLMAMVFAASAVNALLLWNLFPMHMRGAERTATDTMHLILSANPFVLVGLIAAIPAFKGMFRLYSIATILAVVIPAALAFQLAPELDAGRPTPFLGLSERVAQYFYELWQALLAFLLMRRANA